MPNPWDAGSARALEQLGFPALATTSAGFAWTLGRPDNDVDARQALEHLRAVVAAVDAAGQRRLRGRLRGRPGGRQRERQACRGDRHRRAVDRGLHRATRRSRCTTSTSPSSGSGGPPGDRRQRHGRRPDRSVRGLRRRASRHRRDDPTAAGVRRGRRRLPLRPADRHRRAGLGDRRGRGTQAGEPADQRAVHHRRRGRGTRRTADQCRRNPGAHRVGRLPRGAGEIADTGTFSRFEKLPDVEALLSPHGD